MRSTFLHDPIICSFHTQEAQELFSQEHKKNKAYLTGHLEGQPVQDTHKQPRTGGDWEELLTLAWLSYFSRLFPRQLERGFLELFMRMPGGQPEFSVPKVIHFPSLIRVTIPYVALTELLTQSEHLSHASYSARCWGGGSRFRKKHIITVMRRRRTALTTNMRQYVFITDQAYAINTD